MQRVQSVRPRIFVVSYYAADALTPRGARTQAIVAALRPHADVRVLGAPAGPGRRTWWHRARDRALGDVGSRWLIDQFEPWSWRALGYRRVHADVALLIGYPFSPLVVAARALRRHGVPYVVDMSDPWVLTRCSGKAPTLRDRRCAALERALWGGARAGIVTTAGQARGVLGVVPELGVLVRPNGYADVGVLNVSSRRVAGDELHIGHFGALYAPRIDVKGFLRRVAGSRRWRRVVLHQYGRDHGGELDRLAHVVAVQRRDPLPWHEVVELAAAQLDLALVVGNKDGRQLPSKAIEYLTLPLPRLALTHGGAEDALADYVADKPGWLTMNVEDPDPAARIAEHVERPWIPDELAAPVEESWDHVADELATYVLRLVDQAPTDA
jgi:hypothetical protein